MNDPYDFEALHAMVYENQHVIRSVLADDASCVDVVLEAIKVAKVNFSIARPYDYYAEPFSALVNALHEESAQGALKEKLGDEIAEHLLKNLCEATIPVLWPLAKLQAREQASMRI